MLYHSYLRFVLPPSSEVGLLLIDHVAPGIGAGFSDLSPASMTILPRAVSPLPLKIETSANQSLVARS